jgi:hypothetical protein
VVRSSTTTDPEWTVADRGLLLALLEERAETCPQCGHLMSECRDPATAGHWEVVTEVCEPSRVAQVMQEEIADQKRRGVVVKTRRHRGRR